MKFNPDPNKQVKKVLFSRKVNSDEHHHLSFKGNKVQHARHRNT